MQTQYKKNIAAKLDWILYILTRVNTTQNFILG